MGAIMASAVGPANQAFLGGRVSQGKTGLRGSLAKRFEAAIPTAGYNAVSGLCFMTEPLAMIIGMISDGARLGRSEARNRNAPLARAGDRRPLLVARRSPR